MSIFFGSVLFLVPRPSVHLLASKRRHDKDITNAAHSMLSELREYRNSLAPISYLPDEVVAEVLHHVMTAELRSTQWTMLLLVSRMPSMVQCRDGYRNALDMHRQFLPIHRQVHARLGEALQGAPLFLNFELGSAPTKVVQRNQGRTRELSLVGKSAETLALLDVVTALPRL